MLNVTNLIGFGAGSSLLPVAVSHVDNAVNAGSATIYTFSTQSLGVAAVNRKIIVGVDATTGTSGSSVSTLTVGGISGSVLHAFQQDVYRTLEFWVASVPTGTTGDVVVTLTSEQQRCGIGVFRAVNTDGVLVDFVTDVKASGTTLSGAIDCPAGGAILGHVESRNNLTHTWTGITTEGYDEEVDGNSHHSGAFDNFEIAQTSLSVTCTTSSTLAGGGLLSISIGSG